MTTPPIPALGLAAVSDLRWNELRLGHVYPTSKPVRVFRHGLWRKGESLSLSAVIVYHASRNRVNPARDYRGSRHWVRIEIVALSTLRSLRNHIVLQVAGAGAIDPQTVSQRLSARRFAVEQLRLSDRRPTGGAW